MTILFVYQILTCAGKIRIPDLLWQKQQFTYFEGAGILLLKYA
jgi:uncharacterized membrane protein YkgB